MHVIYDSREQDPLLFQLYENITIGKDKLDYGDYTISGHDLSNDDNSVIVERKSSCQELVGNLGKGWDRFCNEMSGFSKYKHKVILVCGTNNFSYLYERGFTKLHPNFVYKQLALLQVEYGVPTIFCGSRENAEAYMYRLFIEIIRHNGKD